MLSDTITLARGCKVLVWRLEEDAPRLLALCRERGVPCEDLPELPVKRQREKAAERLLLREAFGRPVTLSHTVQGAPRVDGERVHVSITHTLRMVALALSENHAVGIDAEQIDRRQVLKVRDKFLNPREQGFIAANDLPAHIMAWTAKEAVIKATGNSAIDWTNGIVLEPFKPCDDVTAIVARCGGESYNLAIRLIDDHYLTVALPRPYCCPDTIN